MDFGNIAVILIITVLALWVLGSFLIFFLDLNIWHRSDCNMAIIFVGMFIGCGFVVTIGLDDLLGFWGSYDEDGNYISIGFTVGTFIGLALTIYLLWVTEKKREYERKIIILKEEIRDLIKENKELEKKISAEN